MRTFRTDLKPHRVAAVLHLPAPLLVTAVHCIELTIAVPSWTDSDKEAVHKPLLIHMNELLVQVRNIWECSSKIRREAEERVQAALLEPDPLGSTAAMFAFARDINDRTKLMVDKLQVQIFVGGVPRVEMTLADLHARTTDALWQDVEDPTTCVDYSPDHLVQTRFKAMSFMLSVGVNPPESGMSEKAGSQTIHLMTKVSVGVRVTRFYHRREVKDSWRRHMQLVDINFGAMKMEFGVADFVEVYTVVSTFCNWVLNGRISKSCALTSPEDGMAAYREPLGSDASAMDQQNIQLQVTFRGTIEAKLKFTSPTEGPQELCLVADRAAGNVIIHRHGVRELQMSLHELTVRFRGYVVFRLKPDREVFQLRQRHHLLSVKWRVQGVLCRIDDDLTTMLTEMYTFVNDKEQPLVIRCGTCHQQISMDMIDVHVCPPRKSKSLLSTPHTGQASCAGGRRTSFSKSSSAESSNLDEEAVKRSLQVGPPQIHIILHMDELELQIGSHSVDNILKLFSGGNDKEVVGRDVTAKLSNLRLTTESNEFAGDAIFVPALPLAFQMLECSLQGCGCILRSKSNSRVSSTATTHRDNGYRWPARLFLDVAHCAISAHECFVKIDKIQMRSSFSDGSRVCFSSQPQVSFHICIDKIRSQLDEVLFKMARHVFGQIVRPSTSDTDSKTWTLFLGVLQIRAIEFTLQGDTIAKTCAKSLLKQAIMVFDNQLGYLCIQSSLDFKTILNSNTMRFLHRQIPAVCTSTESLISHLTLESLGTNEQQQSAVATMTDGGTTTAPEENPFSEKAETQVLPSSSASDTSVDQDKPDIIPSSPPDLEREDACRCIQRMVRRKQLVRQRSQHFKADDYETGVVTPFQTSSKSTAASGSESGSSYSSLASSPRKLTLSIPSPIMILGVDNDFVGDIRGGLSKLMSPLTRTRLPSDSIRDGINKLMGPINRSLSPTGSVKLRPSVESVAPMVEVTCYNVTTTELSTVDSKAPSPNKFQDFHQAHRKQSGIGNAASDDNTSAVTSSIAAMKSEENTILSHPSEDGNASKSNGLSEARLAALPDVVRVLVQLGECRLCVPINPREKIEFLCTEIVRRFNESFAGDFGSILAVSLQDKHGGVFCPSDTVGFVLSVTPSELLFAYPHEHDGPIRSLVRLTAGLARTARSRQLRDVDDPVSASVGDGVKRMCCSKIPLPLAIALLANETERELIRSGLCGRDSGVSGEAWPDLSLNAASLDAEKNPLFVEVAWHEACIEVTNGDAFALCRQLLGLCTSRVTSKYVGKVLRGRLKVDSNNPLIEWACRRRLALEKDTYDSSSSQQTDQDPVLNISYEYLKKVVQDTFGVYTR
ncbi:unnamed protein product [Phytophthora lilii]|uniref:Unnamed protein product n=1 Tax=Phytophthora lilii TaxID=2077276 RepID=A0A9W6WTZ3_9STRA|nr:unnamed protein product [Phytophthora lilii]